jgi:hypothetical protein
MHAVYFKRDKPRFVAFAQGGYRQFQRFPAGRVSFAPFRLIYRDLKPVAFMLSEDSQYEKVA